MYHRHRHPNSSSSSSLKMRFHHHHHAMMSFASFILAMLAFTTILDSIHIHIIPSTHALQPRSFGVTSSSTSNTKPSSSSSSSLSPTEENDNLEVDEKLMKDIEMLSNILSEIVQRENPHVHNLYNQFRRHGLDRASDPNNLIAFQQMKKLARDISPFDALGIMRVFSLALNLVNAAEVHHKLRVMKEHELNDVHNVEHVGPLPMVEDSVRGTIETILENGEGTIEEVYDFLIRQKVEIVLTAHPTEGKSFGRRNEFCVYHTMNLCLCVFG